MTPHTEAAALRQGEPAALPGRFARRARDGLPVLVLSVGASGDPHSTYSWAVAADAQTVRFAVDRGSSTSANLARAQRAAVQFVGAWGQNLVAAGAVSQLAARIAAAEPIPLEAWELRIDRLKDQSWPGVKTSRLAYRWPPEQRAAMRKLERAVYAELRASRAGRR